MTDIVTRIRSAAPYHDCGRLLRESADTIERMRSALRVIHTWAAAEAKRPTGMQGSRRALNAEHVRDLCAKALEIET